MTKEQKERFEKVKMGINSWLKLFGIFDYVDADMLISERDIDYIINGKEDEDGHNRIF